jgi:hypothetical protein
MQLKIYEKVDKITLWFYFLLGVALSTVTIWSAFTDSSLGGIVFFSAISLGCFALWIKNLNDKKKGKLNDYTIKCEKYEVILQ